MAKLVYGPDYGSLTVCNESGDVKDADIVVSADQAMALGIFQAAGALSNLYDALQEIAAKLPARD